MRKWANGRVLLLAAGVIALMIACSPPGGESSEPNEPPPEVEPPGGVTNSSASQGGEPTGTIVFVIDEEIYSVADNGSNFRRITEDFDEDWAPALSVDGRTLFSMCDRFARRICKVSADGFKRLQGVGRQIQFSGYTHFDRPALSPDGSKLLFDASHFSGRRDIFVLTIASNSVRRLTDAGDNRSPSWLPNGGIVWEKKISGEPVVVSDPLAAARRLRAARGIKPTVLAAGSDPDVSPDGKTIAYVHTEPSGETDIWTMKDDGSGTADVTSSEGISEHDPSWSPDGTRIAYVRPADSSRSNDLYTIAADGSDMARLTQTGAGKASWEWRPDWGGLAVHATLLPPACADKDPQCSHSVEEGSVGNTTLGFDVSLSDPPSSPLTLNYRVVAGSATAGVDYVVPATTSVTFAIGEKLKTIEVDIKGDFEEEPDESFYVELLPSPDVVLGTTKRQGVITNDDDGSTAIFIDDVTTDPEGDAGITSAVFTVTLSSASTEAVTVQFATVDGTAISPGDYASTSGTLTFAAGDTSETVTVDVVGDLDDEPDETYTVELSNPSSNAIIAEGTGTGTIVNDDAAGAIVYWEGGGEVWLIDPDGTDKRFLTGGLDSDWKPDGTQIAFDRDFYVPQADPEIFQIAPTGGTPTVVNGDAYNDGQPSWSPDGSAISWISSPDGIDWDIYKASPPTAPGTKAVDTPGDLGSQDWARLSTGTDVFAAISDGDLVLFDAGTGSQIGSVWVPAAESPNNPAVSPDGTKLAYDADVGGNRDVYVKDLTNQSAPATRLTTDMAEDAHPTWSPDNTMLVFYSTRNGTHDLFTMTSSGASQIALTSGAGSELDPHWGPSGTALAGGIPVGTGDRPTGRPAPGPAAAPELVIVALLGLMVIVTAQGLRRRSGTVRRGPAPAHGHPQEGSAPA